MRIFVPGRICLFGEHSDWAGGYRRINADIAPGSALITGTNQGVHANASSHASKLIVNATLTDGTKMDPFEVPMRHEALLKVARSGGFYSYAAGVAYQVLTHYRVRGLVIDNDLTDLPVKKGLSSSAAVCVLVARAFNRIYDLKLTTRGEMELAYLGEITTPSRCGRLDQGCAYGSRPVQMTFDGDRIDVREVNISRDMHFVIVDLNAEKDTRVILNDLNHCYPFADNREQENVQEYLGPVNQDIVDRAAQALEAGDAETLGALMTEAQQRFDEKVAPACPEQLKAPVLHKLLSLNSIQELIYGAKGVGSQGDGSAQLVAKSEEAQKEVIDRIQNELGMPCLKLSIQSGCRIRKAVIPAAGFGTRLFPATKAVKKELFPIVTPDGRAKPVILAIVEEAIQAGIEEVAILIQPDDRPRFEEIFYDPPPIDNYNKLSSDDKRYCNKLRELGNRITFIAQTDQEGFGHAVYCARQWVGNEPFMLMLGDHLFRSNTEQSCASQLVKTFERCNRSVIGAMPEKIEDVSRFGCLTGTWDETNGFLNISEFAEKPTPEYAKEYLLVENLPEDEILTVSGQYILKPRIFGYLAENIEMNIRERGEFQLTSCLDRLRREEGFVAHLVDGIRYDIGNPKAYSQTVHDFSHDKETGRI